MDNVISLEEFRNKRQPNKPAMSFEDVAKQNAELKAKLEQERKEKNEQVLKSYRIK